MFSGKIWLFTLSSSPIYCNIVGLHRPILMKTIEGGIETFHFINCSQMSINECILEQQVVILWSSGCRWLLQREKELRSCVDTGQWLLLPWWAPGAGWTQSDTGGRRMTNSLLLLPPHQSLSSSRSTRNPGCYWALIQNLRQSSFDFKTCLPVISTPSAPIDPGQRQVWEKLKTKSRMFAVSCHSHIMHTACFP